VFLFFCERDSALWSVWARVLCASNERWETRLLRFPRLGHDPQALGLGGDRMSGFRSDDLEMGHT